MLTLISVKGPTVLTLNNIKNGHLVRLVILTEATDFVLVRLVILMEATDFVLVRLVILMEATDFVLVRLVILREVKHLLQHLLVIAYVVYSIFVLTHPIPKFAQPAKLIVDRSAFKTGSRRTSHTHLATQRHQMPSDSTPSYSSER